uniref:Uncharacterized protein n=1 Tax=Dikerogammarus haemobaphes virus 1 TaxID=2704946 RepID=A0A6G9HEX6_9VIRU|nr:hypothetical protein [Dikerogammarus haemobaphes virus 1]
MPSSTLAIQAPKQSIVFTESTVSTPGLRINFEVEWCKGVGVTYQDLRFRNGIPLEFANSHLRWACPGTVPVRTMLMELNCDEEFETESRKLLRTIGFTLDTTKTPEGKKAFLSVYSWATKEYIIEGFILQANRVYSIERYTSGDNAIVLKIEDPVSRQTAKKMFTNMLENAGEKKCGISIILSHCQVRKNPDCRLLTPRCGSDETDGGPVMGSGASDGRRIKDETDGGRIQDETDGGRIQDETDGGRIQDKADGVRIKDEADGVRIKDETDGGRIKDKTDWINVTPQNQWIVPDVRPGVLSRGNATSVRFQPHPPVEHSNDMINVFEVVLLFGEPM